MTDRHSTNMGLMVSAGFMVKRADPDRPELTEPPPPRIDPVRLTQAIGTDSVLIPDGLTEEEICQFIASTVK